MDHEEITWKILRLAEKRSEVEEGCFTTEDYIRVCAQIYSAKMMPERDARRHLGWHPDKCEKVGEDVWRLLEDE